jgi:hypothetical protein
LFFEAQVPVFSSIGLWGPENPLQRLPIEKQLLRNSLPEPFDAGVYAAGLSSIGTSL